MARALILLDACVAINLAATDICDHIADRLGVTFLITEQAVAETGYLRDVVAGELVRTPISLERYADRGTVRTVGLAAAEYKLYLELAALVDDGEAATIAVAATRGITLATDDRKARRLCAERGLPEPVRTLSIVRSYADSNERRGDQARQLLIKIRDRASFQPPRADPDAKWWADQLR